MPAPAIPTCAVHVRLYDQNGQAVGGASITAQLDRYEIHDGFVVPNRVEAVTDQYGEAILNLWPNALGSQSSSYKIKVQPSDSKGYSTIAIVPDAETAELDQIAQLPEYPGKPDFQDFFEQAQGLATDLVNSANSAKTAAQAAQTAASSSASAADLSAADAATSAAESLASSQSATTSANAAEASRLNAADSATAAEAAAAAAEQAVASVPIISVLNYGTPANLSAALLAAITALPAEGGTIKVPKVASAYVLPTPVVVTRDNVSIDIDPDVSIDLTAITTGQGITAQGSYGPEINLGANVTTGATTITTTAPHGLAVGDWFLIKSQRACLHADAGVDWRLGEATAGVDSTFFAEPCLVKAVNSATSVTIAGPLIFPNYRTDATQETYGLARPSTTIRKINFVRGFRWNGGSLKSRGITAFYANLCYEPRIELDAVDLGQAYGDAIRMESCLRHVVHASARHDPGLVPGSDHAEYNSFREMGCWWGDWYVVDQYGMQGLDITYRSGGHPSIQPDCYISSYDNAENSMTFHSGAYGGRVIRPRSIRAPGRGIWIRSRFVEVIEPYVLGGTEGVTFQAWGGMNGGLRGGHFEGCGAAVKLERTGIGDGPAYRSITIDGGKSIRCGYGVYAAGTNALAPTSEASGITIRNWSGDQCTADLIRIEEYVNNVTVDGVDSGAINATSRFVVRCNPNTVGHEIRRITGTNIGATNTLIAVSNLPDTTTFPTASYPNNLTVVDADTCKLVGTGIMGSYSSSYIKNVGSTYTLMPDDARGRPVISGSAGATTITIPPGIFLVGARIEILQAGAGQITIAPGSGVTLQAFSGLKSAGQYARIVLQQRLANTWFVTGNTVV